MSIIAALNQFLLSDPYAKMQWNNQAGRDNNIYQNTDNRSVWILLLLILLIFLLLIPWWIRRKMVKHLKFLEKQLGPRIIEKATYSDQAKRCCDPETHENVLRGIKSWIEDISEESKCFYWLSGGPGVGKSAVAASITEHCVDRHILGAQFFINRDDLTTTDPRILFPTISYQLCQRFPCTVAVVVEEIIRDQPSLLNDISKEQATKLFVRAIDTAAATNPSRAVVIIIDALDEADPNRLWTLARTLSNVVADLPRNAKVFVTSRGEDAITQAFESLREHKRVKVESLATTKEEVSQFMKQKVGEILKEYHIDWEDWGDNHSVEASPGKINNSGKACFEEVLGTLTAEGMHDLNTLYLKILQGTCTPGNWEYERFRRIVGMILVRQAPLSINDIARLLDLKLRGTSEPVDIIHFVRQYRTVLVNDTMDIDGLVVPRLHKTFADFITSKSAMENFRVDKVASHGEMALQCINQFDNLYAYLALGPERQLFPSQLVYASRYWQSHLTRMIDPNVNNDSGEKKEYGTAGIHQDDDTQYLSDNPRGVKDLKPDTAEIKGTKSLTFLFSPDGTQFASAVGHSIQLRNSRTGSVIMSLVGHKDSVSSIGFSPDGTQLVSASSDKTARIWDTRTGRELHVLNGHTGTVCYVKYSHNGRTAVTCSYDYTLRSWNTRSGQLINVFHGHTSVVSYCVFSPDDQRIGSISWLEIIVWDVSSGDRIFKIEHARMIVFCPCSSHLMLRDRNGEIMLLDAGSGNQLDVKSIIAPLAFMDDSKLGSESGYISVPQPLAPSSSNTHHMYSFKTEYGDIWGIVSMTHEQSQGVWDLVRIPGGKRRLQRLYFAVGATVMRGR